MRHRINSLYTGLGITTAILLVVALSVQPKSGGPTMLQMAFPWMMAIVAIIVIVGAFLLTFIFISKNQTTQTYYQLTDRAQERNAIYADRQHERIISAKAAAAVVQMLAEGARVKQLKTSGDYIIIDADGSRYTPEQCQLNEAHLDYMIDQQHLLTGK